MTWFDLWPSWSNRWFGWLMRLLMGVVGGLFGFFVVGIANFGATYGERTPEWGGEEITFLAFGLVIIFASVWVFARPAKASLTFFALSLVGLLVVGGAI